MIDRLIGDILKELRHITSAVRTPNKNILNYTASLAADTDVIAAVPGKQIKVIAYSLQSASTTAETVTFKSNGTSGTAKWTVILRSLASSLFGASLATSAPSYLFSTNVGEKLTLDFTGSETIIVNLTYYVS